MSLIPGPVDEAIMYGPKILGSAKTIMEFARQHKALTATVALAADANFNNGKIIGGTLDVLGGAVGKTVSSVASGTVGGVKSMVGSALDGEGGGILKAVGIGGGILAAAPLVLNAVGAIGGLFKRKKNPKPGQIGGGGNNAAIMMQQQVMLQQQMMMQQAMQQQKDKMQQKDNGKDSNNQSQDIAELKAELATLKAANNAKPPTPPPKPLSSGDKAMTASRVFTKGPTKITTPQPSQKPAAHSMAQKDSTRKAPNKNERPKAPVFKTKPTAMPSKTRADKEKENAKTNNNN